MSQGTDILNLIVNFETMQRVGNLRESQSRLADIASQQEIDSEKDNKVYAHLVDALRNSKKCIDSKTYFEGLLRICNGLVWADKAYQGIKSGDIRMKVTQAEEDLVSLLEGVLSDESSFNEVSLELKSKLLDARSAFRTMMSDPSKFAFPLEEHIIVNKELEPLDLLIPRIDITFKVLGRKDIAFSKYGVYPFIVYSEFDPGADWTHFRRGGKDDFQGGLFSEKFPGAVIVNSEVGRYIIIFGGRDHSYHDFYALKLSPLSAGLGLSGLFLPECMKSYGRAGTYMRRLNSSLGDEKPFTVAEATEAIQRLRTYIIELDKGYASSPRSVNGTGSTGSSKYHFPAIMGFVLLLVCALAYVVSRYGATQNADLTLKANTQNPADIEQAISKVQDALSTITGTWNGSATGSGGPGNFSMTVTQIGHTLSGTGWFVRDGIKFPAQYSGTVAYPDVAFNLTILGTNPNWNNCSYTAGIFSGTFTNSNTISGTASGMQNPISGSDLNGYTFTLSRQ